MENSNKNHLIIIIILALIIIFSTSFFLINKNSEKEIVVTKEENIEIEKDKIISDCGLSISFPKENDLFENIDKVSVIVDNTKKIESGCGWTVFEGQAGTFQFFDIKGQEVAKGILGVKDGADWMTTLPVIYEGKIEKIKDIKIEKGEGKLIVTEDDPSGEKVPQKKEIKINF